MGAAHRPTDHHLVSFGDGIIVSDLNVGKAVTDRGGNLLYGFWAALPTGGTHTPMPFEAAAYDLICCSQIPCLEYVRVEAVS